jgi:tRNA pseudouridine55 synthase
MRAYPAARRGGALALAPVPVVVHAWEVLGRTGADLAVRITCGGGTYIRALARDLGALAGSAAHLSTLRRIRSGPFLVNEASAIDRIDPSALRPLTDAIPSMPRQPLDMRDLSRVRHGNSIGARVAGDDLPFVALVDGDGSLAAIALRAGDELRPKVVLHGA